MFNRITLSALTMVHIVVNRAFGPPEPDDQRRPDRGDVPGWVMITVMTAR